MPSTSNAAAPSTSASQLRHQNTPASTRSLSTRAASTPGIGALLRHEWRLNGHAAWGLIAAQATLTGIHLLLGQLPISWSTGIAFYVISILHICGIMFQLLAIAVVAAILLISYYQSMHGQYAYFTAAVPVRSGAHLLVKTLWAYAALLASVAMGVLGLIVGVTEFSGRSEFGAQGLEWESSLGLLRAILEANPVLATLCFAGAALVILQFVCEGAFIVTVGSSAKFSRNGFAAGVALAIVIAWLARNVCMLIGLLAVPVGVKFSVAAAGAASDVSFTTFDFGTFYFHNIFPLGLFAGEIAVITFFWALNHRQLAKHWNL